MAPAHRPTAAARSRGKLAAALGLTLAFLVVEVAGAWWTGSLALLADAGHMLTDAGGLALALFAIWVAGRPPTPEKTYGYYRAEILAALVNGLVLLAVAAGILWEAYRRLLAPPAVLGAPMLASPPASSGRRTAACSRRPRCWGPRCSRSAPRASPSTSARCGCSAAGPRRASACAARTSRWPVTR